jgi:ppGpp synthetase/RelA/SpoT-type nucleotidyltranferase
MSNITKSQVDRLGERLRTGVLSDDDLRALDDYRRSLNETYSSVVSTIQTKLQLLPTGRPEKSTPSIIAKLKRIPTLQLSKIQDIAGCRIIVSDILEQDSIVAKLGEVFPKKRVVDRRLKPSFGYRAVHIVVEVAGRPIEIQVRTELQHRWAMASENLSDALDPRIKYGGGGDINELLLQVSTVIQQTEDIENRCRALKKQIVFTLTALSDFAIGHKKGHET